MKMHKGAQGVCQKIRMLDDGPDAALVGNLPWPFQLPRVIEGGVEVNDSREFDLHSGWHWQLGGGGLHSG